MSLSSNIVSVNERESGAFEVSYSFSIKNNTDKKLNDVKIFSDFKNTFPENEFEIKKLESSSLKINPAYNGLSNTEIIEKIDELQAQNSASIFLTLEFNPGSSSGPFENKLRASGLLEGKKIEEQAESNTKEEKKEEDKKEKEKSKVEEKKNDEEKSEDQRPKPPEPVETNLSPRDIKFFLVDIESRQEIIEVKDGDIIDFSQIEYRPFTLVAVVTPGTKGSVKFGLDGKKNYRVENGLPYAIAHNSNKVYEEWRIEPGAHTVTLSVHTERGGKGSVINDKTINFEIINYELIPIPVPEEKEEEKKDEVILEATSDSASSSFTIEKEVLSEEEINEPIFEEVIEEDTNGNVVSTTTVQNKERDTTGGKLEFKEETGKVLSIAIIAEDEAEVVPVNNPFEPEQTTTGNVAGMNVSNSEGRVLAATGINITRSVMIGVILVLSVLELNLIRAEKKLFTKIVKS